MEDFGLVIGGAFGLVFGIYLWLGIAVSYLRDIRDELRKRR